MGLLPLPACQFLLMTLLLAGGVTSTAYLAAGQGVPEPEDACQEDTVLAPGYVASIGFVAAAFSNLHDGCGEGFPPRCSFASAWRQSCARWQGWRAGASAATSLVSMANNRRVR
jgi:hypothetical protein